MSKIYVVTASTIDSHRNVRGFADEGSATAFKVRCEVKAKEIRRNDFKKHELDPRFQCSGEVYDVEELEMGFPQSPPE